jgi:3-keto-5-aminohexanoate cleavage enzyme
VTADAAPRRKVIVTVAPTGGFLTRRETPHVPLTAAEIAADVARCHRAGAAVAALHARRPDGQATCDPAVYREINEQVRERCDIVISNSTGGGLNGDLLGPGGPGRLEALIERREVAVEAGAEICSLNAMTVLASTGHGDVLMSTSRRQAEELALRMSAAGVKPEWEAFGPTDLVPDIVGLSRAEQRPWIGLCFGLDRVFQGAVPFSPRTLQYMVDLLPPCEFGVSCRGQGQPAAITMSVLLGGHVRVGLEDCIRDPMGRLRPNVWFVERAVRILSELGHEPATPAEARQILGLP